MLGQAKERLADYLVRLSPEHPLFQAVFRLRGRLNGFEVKTTAGSILIKKGTRTVILGKNQFAFVPFMLNCYDLYFDTIEGERSNGGTVLNFSEPGLHCYKKSGVSFFFPSIPEDDVMDAYTAEYIPERGDIVWDAGAHAGATSYFLAQLVGPTGRVYAFEPDEWNYGFLVKNIDLHHLSNVVPVKKALAARNGSASFSMDGTQASAMSNYLSNSQPHEIQTVITVSIGDACAELGEVPKYIKMDIEGAEVEAIEGSLEFIKAQRIHFVFESNHRANGEMTYKALERLFPQIGYEVWSSDNFGQKFTWARPREA